MSLVGRNGALFNKILRKQKILLIPKKYGGHWLKDYKPNPKPPSSDMDIIAAAKKYELLPAEYETYPDDGFGYGDYPKITPISGENRDKFYPWDSPEIMRNFNEVLYVDEDVISETRVNVNWSHPKSLFRMLVEFLFAIFSFAGVYYWLEDKKCFLPLCPKQYPAQRTECNKHYTFEQIVLPPEDECPY